VQPSQPALWTPPPHHSGIYETAEQLYPSLVPLVRDHLAAHPSGRVCLTGHSLGGSLATVLMLLLVCRGELPPAAVAPVYTFGAPAVFLQAPGAPSTAACEGHAGSDQRAARIARVLGGSNAGPGPGASPTEGGLLERLGLDSGAIHNVIMHRDLVPRIFVCDFSMVAGFLKSWKPLFRDHAGLDVGESHKVTTVWGLWCCVGIARCGVAAALRLCDAAVQGVAGASCLVQSAQCTGLTG